MAQEGRGPDRLCAREAPAGFVRNVGYSKSRFSTTKKIINRFFAKIKKKKKNLDKKWNFDRNLHHQVLAKLLVAEKFNFKKLKF